MHPRTSILAVVAAALTSSGCIMGVPTSMQATVPAGPDDALGCATHQLKSLGYTIAAGDSKIGFVRGEKHLPTVERWLLPGTDERDVLTAMVLADPATGKSALRVTAGVRNQDDSGAPSKYGRADARAIVAACTEHAAVDEQGSTSG